MGAWSHVNLRRFGFRLRCWSWLSYGTRWACLPSASKCWAMSLWLGLGASWCQGRTLSCFLALRGLRCSRGPPGTRYTASLAIRRAQASLLEAHQIACSLPAVARSVYERVHGRACGPFNESVRCVGVSSCGSRLITQGRGCFAPLAFWRAWPCSQRRFACSHPDLPVADQRALGCIHSIAHEHPPATCFHSSAMG